MLLLAEEKSKLRKKRNNPLNEERYVELRADIQRKIRRDNVKWIEDECNEIAQHHSEGRTRSMYEKIRSVTKNSRQAQQGCIKDKDGKDLNTKEDILERWREYGETLFIRLDGEEPMTLEDIEEDELEPAPLLSEIEKAIKQLKIGKSPGLDGLPQNS